jgi:hypothetical protein
LLDSVVIQLTPAMFHLACTKQSEALINRRVPKPAISLTGSAIVFLQELIGTDS